MKRLPIVSCSLVALAVGWAIGSYQATTADAKPRARKPSCRVELAQTKQRLAEQERATQIANEMIAHQLRKEQERVRLIEARIGQRIEAPLPD